MMEVCIEDVHIEQYLISDLKLPDELMIEIFKYSIMTIDDLITLSLVSKNWRDIATDEIIWFDLVYKRFKIPKTIDFKATPVNWRTAFYELLCNKAHTETCFECGCFPIIGSMYKCFFCKNYYLCENCYEKYQLHTTHHDTIHELKRIFIKIRYFDALNAPLMYYQVPTMIITHKVTCNGCRRIIINGTRYKCKQCTDYSLCTDCNSSLQLTSNQTSKHSVYHAYYEILFNPEMYSQSQPLTWCDSCLQPINGTRFKCLNCFNYDLCSDCEANEKHKPHHIFLMMNGISFFNLQYIDWLEKNDTTAALIRAQNFTNSNLKGS